MKWNANLLNFLYRPLCPICQRNANHIFCIDCDRQIQACQNSEFNQAVIENQIPLYSWGNYSEALKRAVEACKYGNNPEIAIELGKKMGDRWRQEPLQKDLRQISNRNLVLVPIPLHAEKLKSRGFNQAERLAQGFSDRTQIPCRPNLLNRVKNTQPQFQMTDVRARSENLKGAFKAYKSHLNLILVDDIYTSGTTIREAIAAFAQVETKVVAVVVLARPPFSSSAQSKPKSNPHF
jgi:ComF family protein